MEICKNCVNPYDTEYTGSHYYYNCGNKTFADAP